MSECPSLLTVSVRLRRIFHAACRKPPRRRYLALKFARAPRSDRELASLWRHSGAVFRPHERFAEHASPRIRALVEGLPGLVNTGRLHTAFLAGLRSHTGGAALQEARAEALARAGVGAEHRELWGYAPAGHAGQGFTY